MKKIIAVALLMVSVSLYAQKPEGVASFELYGDHIIIPIVVDGSEPMSFIFDSGAGYTVIDFDAAKAMKLNMDHKGDVAGAQGAIKAAAIKHNSIELGTMKLESDITIEAIDLNHLSMSIGRKIDGIIGYDLLHHHVARLNYDDMKVEIYKDDAYPTSGKKVGFKLQSAIPVVKGYVTLNNGERLDASFFVNTGAGTTMDFNTPFAKKNKVINKTGDHYSYLVKGVGNKETVHYEGRVEELDLKFYSFSKVPVGISQTTGGIQAHKKVSGILGNKLLSKFNILFDYKNNVIYFEPNGMAEKTVPVNCSGLDVQMSSDMSKVLIHQVQENGPAADSGINVNDELVSINGKATSDLSLIEIEDMLKKPGTTAELVVKGTSGEKTVKLELEELL
ncbi:aspartyl protease family protein [Marinoscillum sp. MHG1-6]|uniref:aspartyl protease family protein n=1 Tax=Marinoscillum sp. MHG1-6 TaxID=2959627 RepID=UPI002157F4AE|nr:aspartyl protease family protein [Marinoscillum sp. MHG1-6]